MVNALLNRYLLCLWFSLFGTDSENVKFSNICDFEVLGWIWVRTMFNYDFVWSTSISIPVRPCVIVKCKFHNLWLHVDVIMICWFLLVGMSVFLLQCAWESRLILRIKASSSPSQQRELSQTFSLPILSYIWLSSIS